MSSLIEALGAKRVLEPPGALPQAALRLDAATPLQPYEIEIAVDTLCVDSSSFRQLVESNDRDPTRVGEAILRIVAERGKMQNPVTGSGGVLAGTVQAVGDGFPDPPSIGSRVVTMVSLTLTPLRLEAVGEVDCDSAHVPVTGTAHLAVGPTVGPLPRGAFARRRAGRVRRLQRRASQTRELIDADTRTVLVLGGGHAGLVALAAARDALISRGDSRADRLQRAHLPAGSRDLEPVRRRALRRPPQRAAVRFRRLEEANVARADLTVVVVNAGDCEAAAILLTAPEGTVLFFSMATSFTKAALGSDGLASTARMLVGSGHAPDRGAYALELIGIAATSASSARSPAADRSSIEAIEHSVVEGGQCPRALGVALQRILEREADRAGDLLAVRARLCDRRSGVGERIGARFIARQQLDAPGRGGGAGEQLLDRRQSRQGAAERAALANVVCGQIERAEPEAGEVPDSGRQPGGLRRVPASSATATVSPNSSARWTSSPSAEASGSERTTRLASIAPFASATRSAPSRTDEVAGHRLPPSRRSTSRTGASSPAQLDGAQAGAGDQPA